MTIKIENKDIKIKVHVSALMNSSKHKVITKSWSVTGRNGFYYKKY